MRLMDFFARRPPNASGSADPDIERKRMLASLLAMVCVVEARDPYTGVTCGACPATPLCFAMPPAFR